MARYLVTGGAGFIGSHLAERLLDHGDDVVIVDNLSTGRRENIPTGAEVIEADLSDAVTFARLPDLHFDGVFHMAAQSSGALSQVDPYFDLQANVGATILLARWCVERGISRMCYASSMTVYGAQAEEPLDESVSCYPISIYGASKLASENYLRVYARAGLRSTCLRIYNAYGPRQNLGNRHQGMVSIYLAYLLDNVPVPVTGSLDRYRDFIYIDDVVSAFYMAMQGAPKDIAIYNVGTGTRTVVRDLLRRLIMEMGLPPDHAINELAGNPSDLFGSEAKIESIRADLGWKPRWPLENGLREMVTWAKNLP